MKKISQAIAVATLSLTSLSAFAQDKSGTESLQVTGQTTLNLQGLGAFHSPYAGVNSLASIPQARMSSLTTVFMGKRFSPRLEAFIDAEMARGGGIGEALGLAGFTNGDVIRNPSLDQDPYLARYFIRWTTPP